MPVFVPNPDGSLRRLPQPPSNPLTGLRDEIREQWRQHNRKAYRELQKAGVLDEVIESAYQATKREYNLLVESGMPFDGAWEIARENWLNHLPLSGT